MHEIRTKLQCECCSTDMQEEKFEEGLGTRRKFQWGWGLRRDSNDGVRPLQFKVWTQN